MKISQEECRDLDRALSLEWLETNGRGGFSSGTVAGANTRRYHGLLLTARNPPSERFVLVNHLDEWIDVGGRSIPLSTNLYPGAVHPDGYKACAGFTTDPWPTWTYECGAVGIQRELCCVQGRNLVVVRWRLLNHTDVPVTLRVRPMLSGRDYHAIHHENPGLDGAHSEGPQRVCWQPYRDLPAIRGFHSGGYRHEPQWFRRVQFPVEQQRGLDHSEDWWSPGEFTCALSPADPAALAFTDEPVMQLDIGAAVAGEAQRRTDLASAAPKSDPLVRRLWLAAECYLSERGSRQTVVAGYPWFTDWGRDTFISLPGLCLVTGRYEIAWQVIESFAAHVSEGMIPNRFPDAGEQPDYNTIDASLWFVQAIDRYLVYTNDRERVRRTAWPAVQQILDGYRRGTRYGIKMDRDGLIAGGVPGVQLTWMDAKVGDWVVTPRHGKPVEIQALWIRALAIGESFAMTFGDAAYAARCKTDRAQAVTSFRQRFWYPEGGYLYDVIDGPEGNDASLRPNQLYALAVNKDLVSKEQATSVLRIVEANLLTPVGLRTLSPHDNRYRPRYDGGVVERDGAYHQGTVWPFLLGPFVTAWINVHGKKTGALKQARTFLEGFDAHLRDACLGQVSEIFDAESPHRPRGCVAQAWSIAEPLRALIEDLGFQADLLQPALKRVALRSRTTSIPRSMPGKRGPGMRPVSGKETRPTP
ncbi:MAG: glycogen debranching protein [Nitrospira sp. CR2.1]|nr:glycogen debranching protein [Nitrospira sp. CR2.1]